MKSTALITCIVIAAGATPSAAEHERLAIGAFRQCLSAFDDAFSETLGASAETGHIKAIRAAASVDVALCVGIIEGICGIGTPSEQIQCHEESVADLSQMTNDIILILPAKLTGPDIAKFQARSYSNALSDAGAPLEQRIPTGQLVPETAKLVAGAIGLYSARSARRMLLRNEAGR